MVSAIAGNGKIISCGDGGSMCDAMHFAEELTLCSVCDKEHAYGETLRCYKEQQQQTGKKEVTARELATLSETVPTQMINNPIHLGPFGTMLTEPLVGSSSWWSILTSNLRPTSRRVQL